MNDISIANRFLNLFLILFRALKQKEQVDRIIRQEVKAVLGNGGNKNRQQQLHQKRIVIESVRGADGTINHKAVLKPVVKLPK